MPLYECVFIARGDATQQQVEAIADHYAATIAAGGGEVKKREYWGLRQLAYKIKKNRKGHYMLLCIDAPATAVPEAQRQLSLNEDVLRSLLVRVEAIKEGPSAMLGKKSEERALRGGPKPAGRFASGRARADEREEFRARPLEEIDSELGEE